MGQAQDEFVGPFPSWANVQTQYGAKADGVTDDSDAIQRGLNDLVVAGKSRVLYLPAGTYRITRTLTMTSQLAVTVVGADPSTTVIRWDGAAGGDMLYANGVRYSRFGRITWDGAGKARAGVNHGWDGSVQGAATANEHHDEVFRDLQFGIKAGSKGRMDAETAVNRCKFIRCSQAGVSIENWNALDWWIRNGDFQNCRVGVTNEFGAGNFHVYYSNFQGSTVADVKIGNTLFYSLRGNTSVGSNQFLLATNAWRNSAQLTLQDNVILDTLSPISIQVGNLGPLMMIDNVIRSRSGVSGPVVQVTDTVDGAEVLTIGNQFTVNNPISAVSSPSARVSSTDDTVVAASSLNPPLPALPGTPPKQNRTVFEVAAGAGATAIQQAINSAVAAGNRAVVHLPAANYSVAQTLTIPANAEIQIVGDGQTTSLNWTGASGGVMFQLAGPSRAIFREMDLRQAGTAVVLNGSDQAGARVHAQQLYQVNKQYNIIADSLNNTLVNLYDYIHYGGTSGGISVIGGSSPAGSRVGVFGSAASTDYSSSILYNVTLGGNLVVQDAWYEGQASQLVNLKGRGTITLQGGRVAPYASTLPNLELNGFQGIATFLGLNIDGLIKVSNETSATNALFLGLQSSTDAYFQRVGSGGVAAFTQNHVYHPDGSYQVADQGNPETAALLRTMLQQTRSVKPGVLTDLAAGITDARFFRVSFEGNDVGLRINGGGGAPPPPPPNQNPTVSLTGPASGSTWTEGQNIVLTATAADSDGTVAKVEFFAGSTKLGEATASPYSYTWSGATAGNYTLTAKATDNLGATATSGGVSITVAPAPPVEPVPTTGLGLWLKADAGVTLNGSKVAAWADQSGSGNDATQGAATSQPLLDPTAANGLPGLRFDGVQDSLNFNLPVNGLSGMSVFFVSANDAPQDGGTTYEANAPLFWNETANWGGVHLSPFQSQVTYRFGTGQANNQPMYTRPAVIPNAVTMTTAWKSGSAEALYVNGTQVLTQAGDLTTISGAADTGVVGCGYNGTCFNGRIAEILVYTRALTNTERQQVESYLMGKYMAAVTNQAPAVNAGPDLAITLPGTAALNGTVTDDGLPSATVTIGWSKVSGPGTVTFSAPASAATTATFSAAGTYLLRLTANDSALSSSNDVSVVVSSTNQAPVVNAGPDLSVVLPNTANLNGTVTDDGLPSNTLTISWSKVSGPGTVTFSAPASAVTTATFSAAGTYVLRLTGNDSALSSTNDVTVAVSAANQAPVVNAGPGGSVLLPNAANLNGTATDDGLPSNTLTISWSKVSGPGTVTFSAPSSAVTTATFSAAGTYVLRLTGNDSALSSTSDVTVVVSAANQAPSVNAGPDLTVVLPNQAALNGTATDDGLPSNTLTISWSKVSGPGTVTFSAPASAVTKATFSTAGTYVLRLTASDSKLSSSDDATVTVNPQAVTNQPPVVNAGPDLTVTLPNSAALSGTVSDDGLPSNTLTTKWSKVSGPGTVTFSASTKPVSSASFSVVGTYVLRLTASDSVLSASDDVSVVVSNPPVPSSGLGLWLRGDSGVQSALGTVSKWADQSGNGRDAVQPNASQQPALLSTGANGKPALNFDGSSDSLSFNLPLNGLNGATVFIVGSSGIDSDGGPDGNANAPLFWDQSASGGMVTLSPFQRMVQYKFGTGDQSSTVSYMRSTPVGTSLTMTATIKDSNKEYVYVQGQQVLRQTRGKSLPLKNIQPVGNLGRGSNTTFFTGTIAEVIIYTRALTDTERKQVESYLRGKYSLP